MNIFTAQVKGLKKISLNIIENHNINIDMLKITNGHNLIPIRQVYLHGNELEIELSENINIKETCIISYYEYNIEASFIPFFHSKEFNNLYFTSAPLGCYYTSHGTYFSVWSPVASYVNVLLYKSGNGRELPQRIPMTESNGLWSLCLKENIKGFFYTYEVKVYHELNEAVDPYARAVGINGLRGAVIDLNETNPKGFHLDISPVLKNFTDAIIYETSIRDISIAENSNILNKGKFLGLAEENTVSNKGIATGLNHLKELGVTHVQLMPVFDISHYSIDEACPVKYNWGYDPQNYNVPEGSYSTNAYDPHSRITELKSMIMQLHRNGICVNMDVVYNHVFHRKDNSFEKIFPGYYFRCNEDNSFSNGSGCSNDTASEQLMMRRFILDSVIFWAQEYHMDGFRFDLMGLHDIDTMNTVRENLDKLERNIMLYGEGWDLNTYLSGEHKASQYNCSKMPKLGYFNDNIRDGIKGSVFLSRDKGFANGKEGLEHLIKTCVTGNINYNESYRGTYFDPEQSVNYVSCHDNNTLWDKLLLTNGDSNLETLKALNKLCDGMVLTSQGIAFLNSGADFCRTKQGIQDSFKSPDTINKMDWDRKAEFIDVFNYYKGLIKLRKEHPAFRMPFGDMVRKHLKFIENTERNAVIYELKDHANKDIWKNIFVIYNANNHGVSVELPEGKWNVAVNKTNAGTEPITTVEDAIVVEGISLHVLYQI